jgi:O-antigen ligase
MFWISFLSVLVLFAGFLAYRQQTGHAKIRIFAMLVIAMIISSILFVQVTKQHPSDAALIPSAESGRSQVLKTFSQSERYRIWQFWTERVGERPLTGVGFGRDLPHLIFQKPAEWPNPFFAHAHNMVLNYGLQMGIPGIFVLLFLFGAMTREFWQIARLPDNNHWEIGLVGIGLIVAVFTKNMTDDLFWRTDALLFWAFAGILLGYGARLRLPSTP